MQFGSWSIFRFESSCSACRVWFRKDSILYCMKNWSSDEENDVIFQPLRWKDSRSSNAQTHLQLTLMRLINVRRQRRRGKEFVSIAHCCHRASNNGCISPRFYSSATIIRREVYELYTVRANLLFSQLFSLSAWHCIARLIFSRPRRGCHLLQRLASITVAMKSEKRSALLVYTLLQRQSGGRRNQRWLWRT